MKNILQYYRFELSTQEKSSLIVATDDLVLLAFNCGKLSAAISDGLTAKKILSNKFPTLFFAGVFAAVIVFVVVVPSLYSVMPRNTLAHCTKQFTDSRRTKADEEFCDCIHKSGEPLDKCLNQYNNAPEDTIRTP